MRSRLSGESPHLVLLGPGPPQSQGHFEVNSGDSSPTLCPEVAPLWSLGGGPLVRLFLVHLCPESGALHALGFTSCASWGLPRACGPGLGSLCLEAIETQGPFGFSTSSQLRKCSAALTSVGLPPLDCGLLIPYYLVTSLL